MTIVTSLFSGALVVSVGLALGSYIGLLINELSADKHSRGLLENVDG